MTMIFNGAELEEVRFNGVDCEEVYLNGALVFEKGQGIKQYLLTVGRYDFNGRSMFGYLPYEGGVVVSTGNIVPSYIDSMEDELYSLSWHHYLSFIDITVGSLNGLIDYSGKWKLTVGTWEGILLGGPNGWIQWNNGDDQPGLERKLTLEDFEALPKSGTHLVTLERIA